MLSSPKLGREEAPALTAISDALPAFALKDGAGDERRFPTGRFAVLVFVKEDCPTCGLSMPLIEQVHRAFSDAIDVWAVGQDAAGNAALIERHHLTVPMLDDSALRVSFTYGLDTVPTVILADGAGRELRRFVGFGREDWRELVADLARMAGKPAPEVDWSAYPESRPGCGSRSVEPGTFERLQAESEGSPLRARRIEIGPDVDVAEFMFEQGLTDGLPVVPPTPERVLRMLGGTKLNAQAVIATVPPNLAPLTVEKIAINAVMAGCRPDYLPVVIAAVQAICTNEFNIHGVMATTMGASPVIVVNGPIRHRIGMNMGLGALGQGNRANASIGRAVRLVVRNVGGAKPGGTERSTLGNPMKFTMCFAEWEERSPWEPLHVERGFAPDESVVTVFAGTSGPTLIVDQTSRTARQLGGSIGLKLEGASHRRARSTGDTLLVLCPEHVDTLRRDGWTKADLRARIQEITARPLAELLANDEVGDGVDPARYGPQGPSEEELRKLIPKFVGPEYIHIVVAGSEAGKFSAMFEGWAWGAMGSMPVSYKIEDI